MSIEAEQSLVREFIEPETAKFLAGLVFDYSSSNTLDVIVREHKDRPTRCSTLTGSVVAEHIPQVFDLTESVRSATEKISNEKLTPYPDHNVAVNINITDIGGSYRWHYDRNAVTAILYLNTVDGGETEAYLDYRLHAKNQRLQRQLDRLLMTQPARKLFGNQVVIAPTEGDLFVIKGDKTLHSVRPVIGHEQRISVLYAFSRAGEGIHEMPELDRYLFTRESVDSADPNYNVV